VPEFSRQGTWADETDIRPTLLSLVGLHDDYQTDGRVITQLLSQVPSALHGTESLGACYKQLNASVGSFGTDTLLAETTALSSGSASDDSQYADAETRLAQLADARDALAQKIKVSLASAASGHAISSGVASSERARCGALLSSAHALTA